MDLDGLLAIARENGVEKVILESHKNWIDKDPVKSLELSARWLNERKAQHLSWKKTVINQPTP